MVKDGTQQPGYIKDYIEQWMGLDGLGWGRMGPPSFTPLSQPAKWYLEKFDVTSYKVSSHPLCSEVSEQSWMHFTLLHWFRTCTQKNKASYQPLFQLPFRVIIF